MATWGSDPLAENPKYTSIRTLSRSGRTFMQLALDRTTGETVVIKFTQRGWEDGRVKYMLRELLIHQELSACHHPHIVELKEVFLTPSHLAAVTEYVEGEDLQTFLGNTGGRVSEALGRFLFQQLVLALDFCHARGKVSRGVKLANTLLALSPGQLPLVKLADFGFSKDTGRNSAPSSQVGTALFVPPEVMHNFNAALYDGALVDVWACGIVLFMLLFGRHPCLRPEDSALSEQQQMLALFTRVAGSQLCLLPEEAAAISPGCADLLGHMLKTEPKERYTMSQVQAHPWFKQGLPAGAALMNATILAEAAARPLALRQSPEALAALVQHGQQMDPQALSSRFGSSQQAAAQQGTAAAAAVGSSAHGPASAVNIPTSPTEAAAARGGGGAIAARVASSTAAAAVMGSSMDEDQGMSWGAPPPARLLIHSCSSNDRAAGLQYKQQEDQMLRSGVLPPAHFHMSESMSSSHGSFMAAQHHHQQQQRQELASLLESIPSAGLEEQAAYSPQQQQQQQQQPVQMPVQQQQQSAQQFNVWLPQNPVSSSTTSAGGAVAGSAPAAAAAAAGHMASEAHSAPAGSVSSWGSTHPHSTTAAAAGGPAGSTVSAPLLQNMQGLALQQQVQQQQAQLQQQQELQQRQQQMFQQQQQQQQSAPAVNGARNLSLLNSADLETLLQLDKAGNNPQQEDTAAAGGVCELEQANSFMLLLQGINSLPLPLDNSVDHLLDPGANPLLAAHIPHEYSQQQAALQQQGGASPAGAGQQGFTQQQQQQQQQQGMGALGLPDDYAAFLVDEDDLAAVRAGGVEGQRGAVRAGAGAGVSSCSLDLRQLSDLLMGGSDLQLLEGSAWHKICKDVSFSRGGLHSGPAAFGGDTAAPSDTVDDATTGAAAGDGGVFDDEDIDALLGLRDMSITREAGD